MNLKQIAQNTYLEFSNYEGSQHIASEFSIFKTLEIIKKNNVKNILEVGLGIGTIPSAVSTCFGNNINYTGTEANPFCLESLKRNLSFKNIKVYSSLNQIDLSQKQELVIVDGKDVELGKVSKLISEHGIIMIEGDRKNQQNKIYSMFPKALFVHLISSKKNHPKGVFDNNSWQGGIKVFFINPTLKQKLYWFKEKMNTKRVYLNRKYL
ncbi:hypothetical protein [Gelatiniphilus marinus]|uniref:Methyltransferase small domain-containing protein n=1 Tax=Gelatiniphilus marinus TaxID=1759464 RepID=A0ABW5JU16_9FLAO